MEAKEGRVEEKSFVAPSVELSLGIGGSALMENSLAMADKRIRSVFTPAQFQELLQQFMIFSYLLIGFEIPSYLMATLWNTTSSSFGFACTDIHKRLPNFGRFNSWTFSRNRSMQDLEPWRCQRTDRKNARSSNVIIPNEKYNELNMQRAKYDSRATTSNFPIIESSNINVPREKNFFPSSAYNNNTGFNYAGAGKGGSFTYKSTEIEFEPIRCKRVDGGKVRLPEIDFISNMENMTQDMYRGIVPNALNIKHLQTPFLSSTAVVISCLTSTSKAIDEKDYPTVNTELSLTIPRPPSFSKNKDKGIVINENNNITPIEE